MPINRDATGLSPNTMQTLMGWNQMVSVKVGSADYKALRVTDYGMGTNQNADAPDYVTGKTDRTAWTKGPVTVEGNLTYPLTFETGSDTLSGFQFFAQGAALADIIGSGTYEGFSIQSSAGELIEGCYVNTATISCNASEPIQCSSTVWGISLEPNASDDGNTPPPKYFEADSFGDGPSAGTANTGTVEGDNTYRSSLTTVQVPMWDSVLIEGAPDGMYITGFNLEIDNQLVRNYTMGNQNTASPWGLNATSISAGQRRITGSLTWQSDSEGSINAILGAGIRSLTITIGVPSAYGSNQVFTLNNCVWNAVPPKLAPGDRVTCESSFTALGGDGATADFDALVLDPPVA